MRKPLLFTLVCVLLISVFNSAWAQTARRRASARSRSSATSPAAEVRQIVVDARSEELFGSFNGRTWSDALKTMPLVKEGETFRLYSLTGPVGTGTIGKPVPPEYPCEDMVGVTVTPLPEGEGDIIGINGAWNAQPRLPKIQSTGQQEYREVVSAHVRRAGISKPKIVILQLLRVDLDGDGTEEVLISASSNKEPFMFMSRGDFSVVLLRRVTRGRAQTIPLVSEVELKTYEPPNEQGRSPHMTETVAAILDVNGDGVMEVVTTYHSVYDIGKTIYEVKGRTPKPILGWGCGH
jgi:hypothetical protein